MLDPHALMRELRNIQERIAFESVLQPADKTEFGFGVIHGRVVAYTEVIDLITNIINSERKRA